MGKTIKIVEKVQTLYDEMYNQAIESEKAEGVMIYRGAVSKIITEKLDLSPGYYTRLVGALTDMGCVEMMHKGGGRNNPSVWVLYRRPTEDMYFSRVKHTRKKARENEEMLSHIDPDVIKMLDKVPALFKLVSDLENEVIKLQGVVNSLLLNEAGFEQVVLDDRELSEGRVSKTAILQEVGILSKLDHYEEEDSESVPDDLEYDEEALEDGEN